MKKLLLSMACVAAMAANAETVHLDCNDATDFQGTFVEQTNKEDGSVNAYAHYQPLQSLKIGDFTFTFSNDGGKTEPAYYYAKEGGQYTIRVYVSNSMTVTAPAGTKMGGIVFNGSNAADALTVTASVGNVNRDKNVVTWGNEESVESVTFAFTGSFRVNTLDITTGEGGVVVPPTPELSEYIKAETIESGAKYAFVCDGKVGTPINETYTYGRLNLANVTVDGNKFESSADNAITITETANGYTLVDCYGRFLAMDDSHLTSFQLYTEVNEGCYWTVSNEDGEFTFTNVLNSDCIICQSKAEGADSFYTNIAPAQAPAEYNVPTLWKLGEAGVAAVEINQNAPVEFYNLQGVRVENPANGLYIRRQGNNVTKVLVK